MSLVKKQKKNKKVVNKVAKAEPVQSNVVEEKKPKKMNILDHEGKILFFGDIFLSEMLDRAQIYSLEFNMKGFYLSKMDGFSFPPKVYDFEKDFREKVLKSFNHNTRNTGVVLEGFKGQGKTMTAKLLALEANRPIIVIKEHIPLSYDLSGFFNSIKQEIVIFVDEFEKYFRTSRGNDNDQHHSQETFLNLLDGAMTSEFKRLVVLTSNEELNNKLINRPARIRYYKKFSFLSKEIFDALIEDKLMDKKFEADLRENISLSNCNIDLVSSIIDEVNIQQLPFSAFKKDFNYKEEDFVYDIFKYVETDTFSGFKYQRMIVLRDNINPDNIDDAVNIILGYGASYMVESMRDGEVILKQATHSGKVFYKSKKKKPMIIDFHDIEYYRGESDVERIEEIEQVIRWKVCKKIKFEAYGY